MGQHRVTFLLYVFLGLTALPACASPLHYSAEAIEATVIDADTQKPLEGVIVTANWQLYHSTVGGRVPAKQLNVLETVTDKNGQFTFPAWGPKLALSGYLDNLDPQLLLFKPGYHYRGLQNPSSSVTDHSSTRRSMWNGKVVEMKKFMGSSQAYEKNFESLNNILARIVTDDVTDCLWKKIPKTIRAMNLERKRLIAEGVNPHTLSSIDYELFMNDKYYTSKGGCGSPKNFYKDLQQ